MKDRKKKASNARLRKGPKKPLKKKLRLRKDYDEKGDPITKKGFRDTIDRYLTAATTNTSARDYDDAGDPITEKGFKETIERYLGHG